MTAGVEGMAEEGPNRDMVALWNGPAGMAWATRPEAYDAMLGELGARALHAARLEPGDRVLDVGCGAGQFTLQAASMVGPAGRVLGVDVSTELVALAGRRAAEAGFAQVETVVADAQEHAFPEAAYDVVISRFGVMFFADPVAAFANLSRATVPGGRLAFVAWQSGAHNDWSMLPLRAVEPYVGLQEAAPPGAPGPFAFGDEVHLRSVLAAAGWADVEVDGIRTTVSVGGAQTVEEAVAFLARDTFGQRLLDPAEPAVHDAALNALATMYAEHLGPDGVRVKAGAWVVSAYRPSP